MGQIINTCKSLVRKYRAESSFGKVLSRKKDNIKIVCSETYFEERTEITEVRVKCWLL